MSSLGQVYDVNQAQTLARRKQSLDTSQSVIVEKKTITQEKTREFDNFMKRLSVGVNPISPEEQVFVQTMLNK